MTNVERTMATLFSRLEFHYRFVVVAQIGDHTFLTAWPIEDTDALPMPQKHFVEIVDDAGIIG